MKRKLLRSMFVFAAVLLMCLSISFPAQAEDMAGDPITTEEKLLNAIVAAAPGDTIEIEDDITLSASAIIIEKEIIIQAKDGLYTLTQAHAGVRHFEVASGGKLTLQNIVLDGQTTGGGIWSGGTLVLKQGAVIKNCKAGENGGAVYSQGEFTMNQGAVLQSCKASGNGGAVYISNGKFIMNSGTISENQASYGGAVCVWGGEFIMKDGKISGNKAYNGGGGIYVYGYTTAFTMTGGLVSENEAEVEGGGLAVIRGKAGISAGTFTNNSAGMRGGAIFNDEGATITMRSTIVTRNNAKNAGGGCWICPDGTAVLGELSGAAVFDNTAPAKCGQDVHLETRTASAVSLSRVILGGGLVNWYNEVNDSYVTALNNLTAELDLRAEVSGADKTKAESSAKVIVSNNNAAYGGGIAVNGRLIFGEKMPEVIDLEVEKIWEGGDPKERPEFITVYLVINGERQEDKFITLKKDNEWKGAFEDLPYLDAYGVPITYSIKEVIPPGYTAGYSELRINESGQYEIIITNTRTPFVDLAVNKIWKGVETEEELPEFIRVYLVANGVKQESFLTLNKSNGWKGEFTGLDYRDESGPIVYTVVEEVPKYFIVDYSELRINESGQYEITITNTRETKILPETGDHPSIWLALLGLSAAGLCGFAFYDRRKRHLDCL